MKNQTENIELNNDNCKEYTEAEILAKIESLENEKIDLAIKNTKKEAKKLDNEIKKVGYKSEEGKKLMLQVSNLYKDFLEKYGMDNLLTLRCGKPSNFGKPQNSRGYGYGNLSL